MALDYDDRTLYVANLHKNVTEELLYELFVQRYDRLLPESMGRDAGPVERVSIPKANNQNFQYGFVTYIHECSIDYAIQLYKGTCLFQKKLLIKKKGNRRPEQTGPFDRGGNEDMDNQEKNQNSPGEFEPYLTKYIHQTSDLSSSSKANIQLPNLMEMAYKRRYRPYDRDSRRQSSGRPVSFDNRGKHRNRSSSHYNKSHRERKGRY